MWLTRGGIVCYNCYESNNALAMSEDRFEKVHQNRKVGMSKVTDVTLERAREIALRLVRYQTSKVGVVPNTYRDLGNDAKNIGVSQEELHCFLIQHIIPGVVSKAFGNAVANMEIKPFPENYGD